MFGFFTLQLHVKTIWYFQFSSDRNGPCWTTNWKWSMKAFCHHINCYFTVEEEGWPPVGKKSRTVFSNKWSSGKGTVGFRSWSPWDGMGWLPGLAVESERPGSGGAKGSPLFRWEISAHFLAGRSPLRTLLAGFFQVAFFEHFPNYRQKHTSLLYQVASEQPSLSPSSRAVTTPNAPPTPPAKKQRNAPTGSEIMTWHFKNKLATLKTTLVETTTDRPTNSLTYWRGWSVELLA